MLVNSNSCNLGNFQTWMQPGSVLVGDSSLSNLIGGANEGFVGYTNTGNSYPTFPTMTGATLAVLKTGGGGMPKPFYHVTSVP
jgi:hypothetical protein